MRNAPKFLVDGVPMTGQQLYDEIIAFVRAKGTTQSAFCRVNRIPQASINSIRLARYPQPTTVERFLAAMAAWPKPISAQIAKPPKRPVEKPRPDLAQQVALEAEQASARRIEAYRLTTRNPLEALARTPAPVSALVAAGADPRPEATSREPCPRCAVRGDLGCEHQRPFQWRSAA